MAEEKKETEKKDDDSPGIDLDQLYNRMDDDWTDRLDRFLDSRLEASEAKPVAADAKSE